MKVYSIGREEGCDIVIDDNSDVISRRHAVINVTSSGKMTIVDYSHNGTYVNGIRIASNVPVPITRKDNVSFSHVARLDWKLIPDTRGKILRYGFSGLAAVVLIVGGIWGYNAFSGGGTNTSPDPTPIVADSTGVVTEQEKAEERDKQNQDSIKNHQKDSLEKAKPQKQEKSAHPKKETTKEKKSTNKPSKTDEPKEENKKRFR